MTEYLAILETDGPAHGGLIPELGVSAAGKSREQVRERLAQGAALALQERQRAGLAAPDATFQTFADLPVDLQGDFAGGDVERVVPAAINPVSLEIEEAIARSGLSDSEVARRVGSSPAAVARMQDYFYWGHSLATLRRLADALGMRLRVELAA